MSEHEGGLSAEKDTLYPRIIGNVCPACLLNPCECPVDDSAARELLASVANACGECGDCYHPVIGPDTDGEPCEWCRDCGCHSDKHTRMTRVTPPGGRSDG